jgi:hypothetical protein
MLELKGRGSFVHVVMQLDKLGDPAGGTVERLRKNMKNVLWDDKPRTIRIHARAVPTGLGCSAKQRNTC